MKIKLVTVALGTALLALPSCAVGDGAGEPPEEASSNVPDNSDGPVGTAQQDLTVSGMGHYCSMTWATGGWAFSSNTNGGDPCNDITGGLNTGGTIRRAGIYAASGVNSVVARCDGGFVSIWVGVGNDPLTWAYNSASGKSGCFFTVAPKYMAIFNSPFALSTSISPGTGFDFSRALYPSPYSNSLDVAQFGQTGSTTATIVDWKGRDKSNVGFVDDHDGHDWGMARGTPILAVADGVVRKARWFDTQCKTAANPCSAADGSVQGEIYIDHTINRTPSTYNEIFVSSYFHLQELDVTDGQVVTKGQVIGKSGNYGWSSGPHLHFAVIRLTNTATNYHDTLTIDSTGNSGWRNVIDPYGFDPPQGFDPWAWRAYGSNAGAFSIVLWNSGQAPSTGSW